MGKPDILTPLYPKEKLHPHFVKLISGYTFSPARRMIRDVFAEFADPDGNFVEQFQTNGFDARTFELFLFAMFRDVGHAIDRTHDRTASGRSASTRASSTPICTVT